MSSNSSQGHWEASQVLTRQSRAPDVGAAHCLFQTCHPPVKSCNPFKKKKKAVEHTFPFLRDKFEWKVSQSFPSGILWKSWFILSLNLDGCALCRSFQRTHSEIKRERQPNTCVLARDDLSVPQFPAARQTGSTLLRLKKKRQLIQVSHFAQHLALRNCPINDR